MFQNRSYKIANSNRTERVLKQEWLPRRRRLRRDRAQGIARRKGLVAHAELRIILFPILGVGAFFFPSCSATESRSPAICASQRLAKAGSHRPSCGLAIWSSFLVEAARLDAERSGRTKSCALRATQDPECSDGRITLGTSLLLASSRSASERAVGLPAQCFRALVT